MGHSRHHVHWRCHHIIHLGSKHSLASHGWPLRSRTLHETGHGSWHGSGHRSTIELGVGTQSILLHLWLTVAAKLLLVELGLLLQHHELLLLDKHADACVSCLVQSLQL